jgi:hypothetical protein
MTIEIDDSGTGDLIGDAFIGFLRKETDELIIKTLPLEFFQNEDWKNKKPYEVVVDLVKEGLKELNFDKKKEKILLCRGNIFDQVRTYFEEEGINFEPAIIEGKLQDAVEGKLVKHLRDLGVRSKKLTKKSGAKRFFILFNWVARDFYNRERLVKNGFKRWRTVWRKKAIEKFEKRKKSKRNIKNKHNFNNKS